MNIYARAKWVKSLLNITQTNGLCTLLVKMADRYRKVCIEGVLTVGGQKDLTKIQNAL